jgi:hypothetical protein
MKATSPQNTLATAMICHRSYTGLKSATAISFVTPVVDGTDEYDSILLEDGTRCYFNSVTPSSVP